jgi:hypothetical protein
MINIEKLKKFWEQLVCKHNYKFVEEKRVRKQTIFGINSFKQLTFICSSCGKVKKEI